MRHGNNWPTVLGPAENKECFSGENRRKRDAVPTLEIGISMTGRKPEKPVDP
jgi:hypothetical protein